jgi:hypothetical protein
LNWRIDRFNFIKNAILSAFDNAERQFTRPYRNNREYISRHRKETAAHIGVEHKNPRGRFARVYEQQELEPQRLRGEIQ